MGTLIIDMVEDIIETMFLKDLRGREPGDLFRVVVPEGDLTVGIHKVYPFLHMLQDFLVDQILFHHR
jgi:hypothetical protein